MFSTISRALKSVWLFMVSIPLVLALLAVGPAIIVIIGWLFGAGGIFQLLRTLVDTAEAGFKHDWMMSEVVLVLLILFLIVRKR
jgi:hypothetical protein